MRARFCPPPRGRGPGQGVGGLLPLAGRHRGAEPGAGPWPSLGMPRPGPTCTNGQGPNAIPTASCACASGQMAWAPLHTGARCPAGLVHADSRPRPQPAWSTLTHARGPSQGLRASLLVSTHSGWKDQPFVLCSCLAGDPSRTLLPSATLP